MSNPGQQATHCQQICRSNSSKGFDIPVSDQVKIVAASLKLDGLAESWYASLEEGSLTLTDWTAFKTAFMRRFDPNAEFGELQVLSLHQTQDQGLEEYVQDFKTILGSAYAGQGMTEFAFQCFLRGLNSNSARDSIIAKRAGGMDPLNCTEAAVGFERTKAIYTCSVNGIPFGCSEQESGAKSPPGNTLNKSRGRQSQPQESQELGQHIDHLTQQLGELHLQMEELKRENARIRRDNDQRRSN